MARGQGAGSLVAITAEGGPIFAVDGAGNIYKGEGCFREPPALRADRAGAGLPHAHLYGELEQRLWARARA